MIVNSLLTATRAVLAASALVLGAGLEKQQAGGLSRGQEGLDRGLNPD